MRGRKWKSGGGGAEAEKWVWRAGDGKVGEEGQDVEKDGKVGKEEQKLSGYGVQEMEKWVRMSRS